MRILLKPLQLLYVIYAFLTFIALMIPVFIWTLIVTPFGHIKGGNLIYRACMLWGDLWFPLIAIPHKNSYEQPLRKGEACIFISNHISYMDIPVIVKTFRQPTRPLGKAEITKVPIFGLIYKNAIVTVARSSSADRARSVQLLKAVLEKGISILVFPEGTFNETGKPLKEFYDGAFRIAIETGAPIRPVLMLDTFDRMHYKSVFSLNPGRSRSVFLEEVQTEGLTMADLDALKASVYQLMEQKLIAYNASWIKD
ncbi:MAG: 1-acyl-sn-glycerol-3-phosphate acyltransferase [Flaviaesturariibacter sp.]|nr:1-acyl-sn-glycerol-3-phosphate acyltransferase [Flaviaesturariibacter sp.]